MTLTDIARHPAYPFAAAGASLALGVGVGLLVELMSRKRAEKDDGDRELPWRWDEDGDDHGSYPSSYPPIPEGVNELPPDKVASNDLFVKPDISKAVDYSRYYDKVKSRVKDLETVDEEAVDSESEDAGVFELIDEEEFVRESGNGDGFSSVTGTYFTQDGILAGWNEDLMEKSIAETVGTAAISRFDDPSVKAVYVRNSQLKVLFEVVRCDDPMEEAILENIVTENRYPEDGGDA